MNDVLIIIPTYNEIENIGKIIKSIFDLYNGVNILVVDDNSPDHTSSKVIELQTIYKEQLYLQIRKGKSGLGPAYIHGFKWAIKKDYNFIFEMDADFSHDPHDIEILYKNCKEGLADMCIGSRYKEGINVVNWPLGRIALSLFASYYVRFFTGMNIKDPTSGFICYKRNVIEKINLDMIKFIGYAFQIEMKYKSYLNKFRILEIPIVFTDRKYGESKLNASIINEAIFGVIYMRIKSLFSSDYHYEK
tara:strand:+ start:1375 stop:2115 length:741 start_codon:yes stop_codon:yes gene_type:complete